MNIDASYNFRRITERLTTSGLVPADALRGLAARGYDVVVNLLPDSHERAVRDEREIVESQGLEYVYIPVDFKNPTPQDFLKFSQTLDRVAGKKIHVHCAANYRVSAFYALYEVRGERWSVEQAMQFISEIWRPAEYPEWLAFIAAMLDANS